MMRYLLLIFLVGCASVEKAPKTINIVEGFEKTSKWLLERPVNRKELEDNLSNNLYDKISWVEKRSLEKLHEESFTVTNGIKLKDFVKEEKRREFCEQIPKGGMLHVHPGGTLSRKLIEKILKRNNPLIDPDKILKKANNGTREKLLGEEVAFIKSLKKSKFNSFNNNDQKKLVDLLILPIERAPFEFTRFQAVFSLLKIFIKKNDQLRNQIYLDYLKRAKSLGIYYVELTDVFSYPLDLTKLKERTKYLINASGVQVRWNVAFVRDGRKEENLKIRDQLLKLSKQGVDLHPIVGIDLVANEMDSPALDAQDIYRPLLTQTKLKATMHAGEHGLGNNVRDALLLGSHRVGHGVLVQDDHITLEYMKGSKKAVEINLVSNVILGVVDNISKHPFLKFHRIGIPITFSTDDEGIFDTDMAKECVLAINHSDIFYHELKETYKNSIIYSFSKNSLKYKLLRRLNKAFKRFETKWKIKSSLK